MNHYTTNEIREAVINVMDRYHHIEDRDRTLIINTLDAAFKRLPDRLPDDTKTMADDYKAFKEHGIIKCGKCGSKIN